MPPRPGPPVMPVGSDVPPLPQKPAPLEASAAADPPCGSKVYDVCIVGAGPQGLAMLSALHNSCAWMTDTQRERSFQGRKDKVAGRKKQDWSVCVLDSSTWLEQWSARFEALGIEWLRSPAMAHPSAFNEDALIEFAHRTGRTEELRELELSSERLHGGGSRHDASSASTAYDRGYDYRNRNMRGLWKTYSGLYALPTQVSKRRLSPR